MSTPSDPLLSREAFKAQVFARSQGLCVLCGHEAVDAHHILERKLYPDGGYYASNGAAVCADCHLLCEHTTISVEHLRQLCTITNPQLPPLFQSHISYDKWGNHIWPSGLRTAGPWSAMTACAAPSQLVGFLGLLMPADYSE